MKILSLQTSCSNIFPLHTLKQTLGGNFPTQHFKKSVDSGEKAIRKQYVLCALGLEIISCPKCSPSLTWHWKEPGGEGSVGARSLGSQATHLWPGYPPPRAYKGSTKSVSVSPARDKRQRKLGAAWGKQAGTAQTPQHSVTSMRALCRPGCTLPTVRTPHCLLTSAFYEELLSVPK